MLGPASKPALERAGYLGQLQWSCGAVGKAQFVESALRELSVTLCRGNHRIVAAYAALNARGLTGRALIPGLPVPTADAGAMDAM